MSPILVRPVREQFEHDRVIRVLQARYKRKYEVAINPGAEQNASVGVGDLAMYPDLVLFSQERSRKIQATIEVETTESVNTLEAMAEWGPFSRLRTPFYLYVPPNAIDTVRRLCAEHKVEPAEIWTYHTAIDQVRFTMVHRAPETPQSKRAAERAEKTARERVDQSDMADTDAPPPTERTDRADVAQPSDLPERPRRTAKTGTAVKTGRSKPAKAVAAVAKNARKRTVAKPAKASRSAKPTRGSKAAKPAKPASGSKKAFAKNTAKAKAKRR